MFFPRFFFLTAFFSFHFLFSCFCVCVSIHFLCFFKGSLHSGRSKVTRVAVGRNTDQSFRVCKVNLATPEGRNKQIERHAGRGAACRNTFSRRKSQILGANDHIHGSRNHRGAAQDSLCLVRVRQTSTRTDIPVIPYLFRHRLHLFGAVVTPTITYGARTWTTTEEHEKNAPHFPAQNAWPHPSDKGKVRKETHAEDLDGKDIQNDEMSEDAQEEEDSTNDEYDQDSSISFENDTESTSSQEDKLEDWIGYIKMKRERS